MTHPEHPMPSFAVWQQRWRWATSSTVRAQARAQTTFHAFLANSDAKTLNDPDALAAALQGASPDLVNAPFRHASSTDDAIKEGLPPLMWAVCHQHWSLVRNVLEHGADPSVQVLGSVIKTNFPRLSLVGHRAFTTERFSPMVVAVSLLDRAWETRHGRDVEDAWDNGPPLAWENGPPLYRPSAPVDHDPNVKSTLDALVQHGASWVCFNGQGRVAKTEDSCLTTLLSQGSSLRAWSDKTLKDMDVQQRFAAGETMVHKAIQSVHGRSSFSSEGGLKAIPGLARMIALGVDPNVPDDGKFYPAHTLINTASHGPLSQSVVKRWALEPGWDWDVCNIRGVSALNFIRKIEANRRKHGNASPGQGIHGLYDEIVAERIEREAQALRRTMRTMAKTSVSDDQANVAKVDVEPSASRSRRRL